MAAPPDAATSRSPFAEPSHPRRPRQLNIQGSTDQSELVLLRIVGTDPPGRSCGDHANVHVGIQHGRDPDQVVPADTGPMCFTAEVTVVDRNGVPDFRGPVVQGRPGARFVYLTWGDVDDAASFTMFRRAKLMLDAIDPEVIRAANETGAVLEARLGLTDGCGMPACAAVRPPRITWTAAPS